MSLRAGLRGSAAIHSGVSSLVGRTPIVAINDRMPNLPRNVDVYAKVEFFNPSSSVKDRLALGAILDAEQRGLLKPGDTIVEATSGNTGISLAMLAAERGYKCVITMTEVFSVERRKIMRAYGAKVVLTPAKDRATGMVKKARELAERFGWFWPRQFETEANAAIHARTTGPEIVDAFRERPLDYFVAGYGTGGTMQGVAKVLKVASPSTRIVLAEPELAPLTSDRAAQKREADGSSAENHPRFNPHPVEGWTPSFIPLVLDRAFELNLVDDTVRVSNSESVATSLDLARTQGLFVGISAGASMAAALKYVRAVRDKDPDGKPISVLTVLPDTGERYLSTPSFSAAIAAEMNAEEIEISNSTPGFHMPPPQPK